MVACKFLVAAGGQPLCNFLRFWGNFVLVLRPFAAVLKLIRLRSFARKYAVFWLRSAFGIEKAVVSFEVELICPLGLDWSAYLDVGTVCQFAFGFAVIEGLSQRAKSSDRSSSRSLTFCLQFAGNFSFKFLRFLSFDRGPNVQMPLLELTIGLASPSTHLFVSVPVVEFTFKIEG